MRQLEKNNRNKFIFFVILFLFFLFVINFIAKIIEENLLISEKFSLLNTFDYFVNDILYFIPTDLFVVAYLLYALGCIFSFIFFCLKYYICFSDKIVFENFFKDFSFMSINTILLVSSFIQSEFNALMPSIFIMVLIMFLVYLILPLILKQILDVIKKDSIKRKYKLLVESESSMQITKKHIKRARNKFVIGWFVYCTIWFLIYFRNALN